MAGIEIPIGAPLDQLTKDLNGAQKKVKGFESQINSSLNSVGSSTRRSTSDFMKWNRVIQDSPYGINGIANNLQELIPNIGLWSVALNVALTALTFIQVGTDNWTRGLKNNKKTVDEAKLSGADYAKTLDQISRAQLLGAQDAQKDITNLELLYKTYQNANVPLKARKEAYKELQTLYPDYFKNIKFEQEASDKTKKAYDELRTAIIATARARAAGDQITQNETRRLENEQKIADLRKAEIKAIEDRNRQLKARGTGAGQGFGGSQNVSIALQNQQAENKVNKIIGLRNNLLTDNNILTARNLELVESINVEIAKGAKLSGNVGRSEVSTDKIVRNFLDYPKNDQFKRFAEGIKIKTETALKNTVANIDPSIKFSVEQLLPIGDIYTQGEIFKEYIQFDLLPQLGQSFTTFFDDILTKGKLSFDSLGKAILSTFASVLASETTKSFLGLLGAKNPDGTKMGSKLLGGALGKILPVAGIALGAIGLLGGLFKKKKPADVPVPIQSNAVSTSAIGSPVDISGGRVVFEISGTNLIGVLNRTQQKLSRYGV